MDAPADTTYNGWSNYPTWAVNLWLSNEEGLYHQTQDAVAFEIRHDDEDHMLRPHVADALKELVEDLLPDLGATFAADLLGYSMGEVDWYELADAWIEDSAENAVT